MLRSLLFPVYRLSRENTQPGNTCDIVFENVKGLAGTVKRTSDYAEAAPEGFYKKHVKRIFSKITRKRMC